MSVTVKITYTCGRCGETAPGLVEQIVTREFIDVRSAAPEGWMVLDPWTRATYCPACRKLTEWGVCTSCGGIRAGHEVDGCGACLDVTGHEWMRDMATKGEGNG